MRAALLLAVLTAAGPAPSPLLTLPPSIAESSGLATSSRSDDVLFTHEDSGSPAQLEAVATDGRLLATYRLPDVQARDWEDIARGPDDRGRSSLFLADIGDNGAARTGGVLVHRVPEPDVDARRTSVVVTTPAPVSVRLVYDDGPRDAEALLVDPRTGRLYVVSKGPGAGLYAATADVAPAATGRLTRVADVPVRRTGTSGGPAIGPVAQLLVTAGDVCGDGSRVALRTYTDLYEWRVPADGDLAGAVRTAPAVSALPATAQGEGLAYARDCRTLLTSSEGRGAPVFRVPSALDAAAGGTPAPAPAGALGPAPAGAPAPAPAAPLRGPRPPEPVALAVAGGLAVAVLVWSASRLRRGRGRTGAR